MVRVIFVETTLPVKIRPRIETSPVKGHFLSIIYRIKPGSNSSTMRCTDICAVNGLRGGLEAKTNILVPALLLSRNLLSNYFSIAISTQKSTFDGKFVRTAHFGVLEDLLLLVCLFDLKFRTKSISRLYATLAKLHQLAQPWR